MVDGKVVGREESNSWAHWSEREQICLGTGTVSKHSRAASCLASSPPRGSCPSSPDLPRTMGPGRDVDQNPGEPWVTRMSPNTCVAIFRRMWLWSRALLPQSCGASCGMVLLRCFTWATTGQRWRETPQGQTTPRQNQTGTSSPLKVGAVGWQGICPGPCSTSCPHLPMPVPVSIWSLRPEGLGGFS